VLTVGVQIQTSLAVGTAELDNDAPFDATLLKQLAAVETFGGRMARKHYERREACRSRRCGMKKAFSRCHFISPFAGSLFSIGQPW
jgi:hypothetical protein